MTYDITTRTDMWLVKLEDRLWISPLDIVALQYHFGGSRIFLRETGVVQSNLSPDEVADRLNTYKRVQLNRGA